MKPVTVLKKRNRLGGDGGTSIRKDVVGLVAAVLAVVCVCGCAPKAPGQDTAEAAFSKLCKAVADGDKTGFLECYLPDAESRAWAAAYFDSMVYAGKLYDAMGARLPNADPSDVWRQFNRIVKKNATTTGISCYDDLEWRKKDVSRDWMVMASEDEAPVVGRDGRIYGVTFVKTRGAWFVDPRRNCGKALPWVTSNTGRAATAFKELVKELEANPNITVEALALRCVEIQKRMIDKEGQGN